MAVEIEEEISEYFVQVELHMDSMVGRCEDADKPFELAAWIEERRLTLAKFDQMVITAESHDEPAQKVLLSALKRCLFRVRFAHKLAEFGIFIVYDGPGKGLQNRRSNFIMVPYMSRELLLSIPAKPDDPKMTRADHVLNSDTGVLLKHCVNELCFVVNAQPFPVYDRRKSDYMLSKEKMITKILHRRPTITAKVFQDDQECLAAIIKDYQHQVFEEYENLYNFCRRIEENNAFEAFRIMFDLPEIQEDQKTPTEKKEEHFIQRKYQWVNGTEKPWLYKALLFYNTWHYVTDRHKAKILSRYGPE